MITIVCYVVTGITNSQTSPAEVSQAVRVGALKIAANLNGVVPFNPGEMLRPIPCLIGSRSDWVPLHATNVTAITQVVHVNVRHAEIARAQWSRINAQTLGINLVTNAKNLGEARKS